MHGGGFCAQRTEIQNDLRTKIQNPASQHTVSKTKNEQQKTNKPTSNGADQNIAKPASQQASTSCQQRGRRQGEATQAL